WRALAPVPSSDCYAPLSLPWSAQRPPGFRHRFSPRRLQSLGRGRSGLHPLRRGPSPALAVSSAAWPARDRRSTCLFHRSCLHRVVRLLCPLLTSAPRSEPLAVPAVPLPRRRHRPPEVRPTAFTARLPDLPPRSLMALDFAITCSLVRPGRPRYPVLVHQAAALLRASFRRRLAAMPLRFANPSPPSGWIEDFHLQAVVHARHTNKTPPKLAGGALNNRSIGAGGYGAVC